MLQTMTSPSYYTHETSWKARTSRPHTCTCASLPTRPKQATSSWPGPTASSLQNLGACALPLAPRPHPHPHPHPHPPNPSPRCLALSNKETKLDVDGLKALTQVLVDCELHTSICRPLLSCSYSFSHRLSSLPESLAHAHAQHADGTVDQAGANPAVTTSSTRLSQKVPWPRRPSLKMGCSQPTTRAEIRPEWLRCIS